MNYIFVAVDSQAGNRQITGPITRKSWLVKPQGSWIADEFERDDKALKLELERYCFRTRSMIKVKVYLVSPSYEQMEMMPTED